MNSNEASVFYGSPIGVEAQPDVIIELTEQGPQGTHGEKGDKGDTGTVTPEMLAILDRAKASAAEAADSLTKATNQADQASKFRDSTYSYYQQAGQVKADTQAIKDAATKDVADAAKSLVELATKSEKAINDVTNPALTEIRSSKEAADAAIDEVRQARDVAKSSATSAQASAAQTATDAGNVADAYNKITAIETNVTALEGKTEAAEKAVDAMNKSVSDNYHANQILKDSIDAAKTAIDEQSGKVSQALTDTQKAAKDALQSATDAAASNTAAALSQKAAEDAATSAKSSEANVSDYLSKTQTLADKAETLKPAIDDAIERNNAINDQISASKTAIEGLSTSTQENANKAITAASNAATSEANVVAAAAQVATDKATVVGANTAVTNALAQVNTAKDSVESDLAQTNAAKAEVDRKLNDFSAIYYGASPTAPTGDIKLGALWLDTSQQPEVLKKYLSTGWEVVAATDVFTKSEVQNMFAALSAGQIKETDNAKIMTADERNKIAGLDQTYLPKTGGTITGNLNVSKALKVHDSLTTNGWIFIENDGTADINNYGIRLTVPEKKADHTAELTMGAGGELRFWMASSGFAFQCYQNGYVRVKSGLIVGDGNVVLGTTGDIFGGVWVGGNLSSHIENRCVAFQNACVTNSRIVGWADVRVTVNAWGEMPNGYFVTCAYYEGGVGGQMHIGGRQPQLFIANRGWFALGEW